MPMRNTTQKKLGGSVKKFQLYNPSLKPNLAEGVLIL